jgi:predicted DNA-binding transcriptional regulator AlpA
MAKRLIGYHGVQDKIPVSRTQIRRMVKDGRLPQPLRLGAHRTSRTVWVEDEVDAAIVALVDSHMRPE